MKSKKRTVYLAAILYAFISGHSFLFGKIALSFAGALDMLAYRFFASFIAALPLLIFGLVKVDFKMRRVIKILPLALLYPLMFFGFQTYGLLFASSSEAGILNASIPIFTLILATLFLKEKTTLWQKISIVASVIGVIYITLMTSASFNIENATGILLILISALSFSGYTVYARRLSHDFTSAEMTIMMSIISFLFFGVLALSRHLTMGTMAVFAEPLKNSSFIWSILYLGVLSTLVTSFTTNYVLAHIEASKMSVFSNLATIISIFAGVVFLKEKIFYYHVIGSVLILGGVLGANFLDKKNVDLG